MDETLKMLAAKLADAGRTELALGLIVGHAMAQKDAADMTADSQDVRMDYPDSNELARMVAAISVVKIKHDTFLNDDILHQVGLTQADLQAAVKTLGTGNG